MTTETRAIHAFREGDIFDNRYRLVKRAGSGGFADVWKAADTLRKDKIVALKIYTRLDDDGIKAMSEEYDETEDIRHENLLTGNHFGAMGNIPYLEMRFCDGGNLSSRAGKMSNEELYHMLHDITNGLSYLHRHSIVHQDIKPENILLDTKHNCYMLADFGISGKSRSRLSRSVKMSSTTLSMTESYAPPEKFSGNIDDVEPDTKGDIFSLGMTLFELAVGRLPYDPPMATGREMLMQRGLLQIDCRKIEDTKLRFIVERCTKFRKEDRPTANDIIAMLNGTYNVNHGNGNNSDTGTSKTKKPTERIKVNFDQTIVPKSDETAKTATQRTRVSSSNSARPTPRPNPKHKYLFIAVTGVAVVLIALFVLRPVLSGLSSNNAEESVHLDTSILEGGWSGPEVDGLPSGEGVLYYPSDDYDGRSRYEGNMHQGLREDKSATLYYTNGNTYKGSFVNDQFGNGRLTLKSDGLYFNGDFKNDKPYNGVWYWDDGTVYSRVTNGIEKEQ